MFSKIKKQVYQKFEEISTGNLFMVEVDRELIWEKYISGFSQEERQGHNCNCCKSFIRQFGGIVSIVDNKIQSIWDLEGVDPHYRDSILKLSEYVHSLPVANIFVNDFKKLGTNFNIVRADPPIKWEHFYVEAPNRCIVNRNQIDSCKGTARDNKNVLKRGLDELTIEASQTVLELISQNSLYRGNEFQRLIEQFHVLQITYRDIPDNEKDNFCWTQSQAIPVGLCKIRNTAIGTLLIDLSANMDLDQAVSAFERVVAPTNYKRPTSLITASMIDSAKKRIVELGLEDSLSRRYATETDISVNDVLFVDKRSAMTDVFGGMKNDIMVNPRSLSKVEEVTIEDFINKIIPSSKSIELLLEANHLNNLVSLVAPIEKDSKGLFKWNNNFSWSYTNGVTDSIKEKVKQAGGRVEGELRVSLSWFNYDDLDLHIVEPNKNLIYYGDKISRNTGGQLDVDMNAGGSQTRSAVENVIWVDKDKLKEGEYTVQVNQYSKRENSDMGYIVEIECNGQVSTFESKNSPTSKDTVVVFNYSKTNGVSFKSGDQKTCILSKEKWGVKTNQFNKVRLITYSPNHWDGQTGNKHYIFILDRCVSDEPARPFFNEFLKEDLMQDRKVFEVLASKMKVENSENQLSGIGFSDTQRNSFFAKVEGNFSRTLKINI